MIMDKITRVDEKQECTSTVEEEDFIELIKQTSKSFTFNDGKVKELKQLIEKLDFAIVLVRSDFAKEVLESIFEYANNKVTFYTHDEYQYILDVRENIILFEYNLKSIRRIELLNSEHKNLIQELNIEEKNSEDLENKNIPIQRFNGFQGVYILNFKNSIEEQGYLVQLRSESELFKEKINKYSKLPYIFFDTSIILDETDDAEYAIQIDFREMRCKLPYFLYRSNVKISIRALEIADYIIGNVVVERKSIGDFINSINTGRLYSQSRNMAHKYKNAYILLEFVGRTCISDYFGNYIFQKIAIFLINFPTIKIIWSNSELMSVKIIRTIQQNNLNYNNSGIDPVLLEILLNLPGIDLYNYRRIIDNYSNLKEFLNSDKESLCKNLGSSTGLNLYNFFNSVIDKKPKGLLQYNIKRQT